MHSELRFPDIAFPGLTLKQEYQCLQWFPSPGCSYYARNTLTTNQKVLGTELHWMVWSHRHCWYQVIAFSDILHFRKILMCTSIVLQQATFLAYLLVTSANQAWKTDVGKLSDDTVIFNSSDKDELSGSEDFGGSKPSTAWMPVRLTFINSLVAKEENLNKIDNS